MAPAWHLLEGSADDLDLVEPLWVAVHHRHIESMPELAPYVDATETWRARKELYEELLAKPDTLLLLATWTYQIILTSFTVPDFAHTICAYIGIWLYGGATLAVGILFSSLTENQIVAAFLSTAVLLGLWLADLAGEIVANIDFAQLLRKLSIQAHFAPSFAYGLVRAQDVAYFAGIIVICLFITIRLVESRRWR